MKPVTAQSFRTVCKMSVCKDDKPMFFFGGDEDIKSQILKLESCVTSYGFADNMFL